MLNLKSSQNADKTYFTYSIMLFTLMVVSIISLESHARPSSESRVSTTRHQRTTTSSRRVSRKVRSRGVSRRKSVTRRRSIQDRRFMAGRSHHRSQYRRRGRRHTTVSHRPYYGRRTQTSSRSGIMNEFILEVGGHLFSPLQGKVSSGMHLAMGSRLGPVAGLVEAQFKQGRSGTELYDLNAQLRVYLPLNDQMEIFPLVAIGQSNVAVGEGSSHLDLGIGAQLNLTHNFAIGGRYSARMIAENEQGKPTNGHNLLAQVSFKF